MTYLLPDEPAGAIRPGLAVGALWPLVTLMTVGPLAGFAWLAFNSWALGCRLALRHTVMALAAVLVTGCLALAIGALEAGLVRRLMLIAVHAGSLCLAYWMMIGQDDAEQWRRSFGPPVSNGMPVFAGLLALRLIGERFVPETVSAFAFWASA